MPLPLRPPMLPADGLSNVSGRGFLTTDTASSPRVAVINEELARRDWPGQDAIGKRFHLDGRDGAWVEIVGVGPGGDACIPASGINTTMASIAMSLDILELDTIESPWRIAVSLRFTTRMRRIPSDRNSFVADCPKSA